MYAVVEFLDEHELAVIPSEWFASQETAYWPPYKSSTRITKSVMHKEAPGEQWRSYQIRRLYETDSYDKARQKLCIAEEESDRQTEDEETCSKSRKRRLPQALRYSESDSEDDIPYKRQTSLGATKQQTIIPPAKITPAARRPFASPSLIAPVPPGQAVLPSPAPARPAYTTPQQIRPPTQPAPPAMVPQNSARDIRLFTILEEIRAEQRQHTALLMDVLKKIGHNNIEDDNIPDGINFPLAEQRDVDTLEDQLRDPTVERSIINHLCVIGGSNVENLVRRLLRHILSTSVALTFNWSGKGEKRAFQNLRLKGAIIKVVRRSDRNATESQVDTLIKEWLRNAKDRDGGRRRRNKEILDTFI